MLFNEVADIAQFDSVNSRTFKDLWNEIQGLSGTYPLFKYFQGREFRRKKLKYFQGCVGTLYIYSTEINMNQGSIMCTGARMGPKAVWP